MACTYGSSKHHCPPHFFTLTYGPLPAWWPCMLWKSAAATSGLSSHHHPRLCPTARHFRKHPAVPPPHFGSSFKTLLLSAPHLIHGSQQGPTTLSFASHLHRLLCFPSPPYRLPYSASTCLRQPESRIPIPRAFIPPHCWSTQTLSTSS